jgi:NAD(P)-dependent dehydrogenase (short-subunit alcohol dehydrogenase family)
MYNNELRVAIVTGGTTGMGGATSLLLAQKGYRVLAVSLSENEQLLQAVRADGGVIEFLAMDLAQAESAARLIVEKAIELWGRLDLLVNCAGTIVHKEVETITTSDWDHIFAVNLKAPFFLAQKALPYLAQTKGNIINVSSTNAIHAQKKNQLYDSLKAALNNLTKGLALDFRPHGVRVNAIMPGGVRTPLNEEWLGKHLGREPVEDDYQNPAIARPEQIASVIIGLASDDFAWVNGVELPIDGGYSLG